MKRSSKKKHINKNQAAKNSKQKQEDKQKSRLKTNHNHLFFGLIFGVAVFIINYLIFFPDDSTFLSLSLSKSTFVFISLIFSGTIVFILFRIEEKRTANISKYTFLILLLYSISISLIPTKEYSNEFVALYHKLKAFQTLIIVPTIAFGIISVWIHKAKIQEVTDVLFTKKGISKEKQSIKNKILSPVINSFSKKEILTTVVLFVIIGISISTLFYRLNYFDLYSDEAQVTEGAAGYYYTGEFKQWDFVKDKLKNDNVYKRGFPHLFLTAQSYKIFGVTPWAGRFVSAFFGLILIIFGYFISYYFTRNKIASLLIILSFTFYFEYLLLLRWTRMYAVLIPSYLILFYTGFKFLTEKSKLKIIQNNTLLKQYLNFNYLMLIPFIFLLIFCYYLHLNSLFILPTLFFFSILAFLVFKEKKYLSIIFLGTVIFIIALLLPQFSRFITRFSFFEKENSDIYSQFLFGFPYNVNVNIIILIIGAAALFLSKNKALQKNMLFLYISAVFSFIFFAYIIKYTVSFRYISFITPAVIILILGTLFLIISTLYNKIIQSVLIISVIISVAIHFNSRFDDLYVNNFASPAKPSIAFKTITDNYKKGEIIYRHWSPLIYLDKIDTSAQVMLIGGRKGKPFHEIFDTLQNNPGGWLTWHTHNSMKVDSLVRNYADIYFKKFHGHGVDKTGVELFYYNRDMLRDTTMFKYEIFFPTGNLNLENSYSIAFWTALSGLKNQALFSIQTPKKILLSVEPDSINNSTLLFNYYSKKIFLKTNVFEDKKMHHIVWYQTGGKENDKFGLYIDGKKVEEKILPENAGNLAKFKINKAFTDFINDIQIYDFPLNPEQVNEIIRNKDNSFFSKLIIDGEEYIPLFHWTKK
ncbi:MAG: hypothetical protein K8R54_06765 [Bacteroidales bacterium]|nr:hypothetical protein [Bacteroidales bacterium]